MSTAVAGRAWKNCCPANSGICWIDGDAACWPIAESTIPSWRELDLRGDHLPALERHPAQPARTARVPGTTGARAVDRPGIVDMLRAFPTRPRPWRCLRTAVLRAQLLRRRRERQLPRRNDARAITSPANCHARGHLRPIRKARNCPPDRSLSQPQLSWDATAKCF